MPARSILSLALLGFGVVFTNVLGNRAYGDASFVNVILSLFSMATALSIEKALGAASLRGTSGSFLLALCALLLAGKVGSSADLWFGARRQDTADYMADLKPTQTPM